MDKITFEKLDDGTCVISVSGVNKWQQKFMHQDVVKHSIYEALKLKVESK